MNIQTPFADNHIICRKAHWLMADCTLHMRMHYELGSAETLFDHRQFNTSLDWIFNSYHPIKPYGLHGVTRHWASNRVNVAPQKRVYSGGTRSSKYQRVKSDIESHMYVTVSPHHADRRISYECFVYRALRRTSRTYPICSSFSHR